MAAFSFATAGATPAAAPTASQLSNGLNLSPASTPQAKALQSATSSAFPIQSAFPAQSAASSSPVSTVNPNANFNNNVGSQSGVLQTQPSTPLKSQTVNNVDGSSVVNTYHPPAAPETPASAPTGGPAVANSVNQYQPTAGLFPQTVTGLANTASTGSPAAQSAIQATQTGAQNALNTGTTQEQQAYQAAQDYQKQLSGLIGQNATENANINNSPQQIDFKQGQEAALQALFTGQENAASQGLASQATLAGIGQTGVGQGITGLGNAAEAANTAQGQAISGLGTAAGLASPQSYGLLNQPYNPITDTYGGGGANGAINRATQAGNIQAAQSNAQAVGTAPVNAQLEVYNQQLQNLGQSQVAASQIAAFGNQLLTTMSQPPSQGGLGINPYDSQFANLKLNQLKTQFNDPQYATFNTNIAGLQARVSSLLQTGEIPTAATQGAQDIVNGSATLASMQATLQQIGAEAGAITGSQAQVASTAYQQAQLAAGGGNSQPIVIPKAGGGNYTFVKNAQGVWVVQ